MQQQRFTIWQDVLFIPRSCRIRKLNCVKRVCWSFTSLKGIRISLIGEASDVDVLAT